MGNDVKLTVGILALQGAFQEHFTILSRLSSLSVGSSTVKLNPLLVKTVP